MPDERSLPEVASDIVREAKLLIRQHVALASAELSEAARAGARHGVQLATAAVFGLLGIGAIGAAAVLGLAALGIPPWAAALIVGTASLMVAAILMRMAVAAFKRRSVLPNTIAALKGHLEEGVS